MPVPTVQWSKQSIKMIDQTLLPQECKYIFCQDTKTLWDAIKRLCVRGAPAIGVAAGFGVYLSALNFKGVKRQAFDRHVLKDVDYLASSRPTAVNLFYALNRMKTVLLNHPDETISQVRKLLKVEADAIYREDQRDCRAMGKHGARLIKNGMGALTVCNAGALATADYGTALGVFYAAKEAGKNFKVFACETRPLLQGARLTTWELMREKIDTTLICDNMAAKLMSEGKVQAVFTGADRIAANGDAANKIGTYGLAVLAKHHKIPFYVVAPFSTFDLSLKSGKEIPIEERHPDEVRCVRDIPISPRGVKVYNPAFDVTDHRLITGLVTERGLIQAPFQSNIKKLFKKHASKKC
jgi:methylthioribose-1-phosphate isomerase